MTDGAALLKAILAAPAEDTPRHAYADWCEETGDPEHAEFIRLQCGLAAMPVAGVAAVLATERAAKLLGRVCVRWLPTLPGEFLGVHGDLTIRSADGRWCYRPVRGFVGEVSCRSADWFKYGDALCAAHPIERVRITDGSSAAESHFELVRLAGSDKFKSLRWPGIRFEPSRTTGWIDRFPPPPAEQDVVFRAPRPSDELASAFPRRFERYLAAMAGRPCPRCGAPIHAAPPRVRSAGFGCPGCGYYATVWPDGTFHEAMLSDPPEGATA